MQHLAACYSDNWGSVISWLYKGIENFFPRLYWGKKKQQQKNPKLLCTSLCLHSHPFISEKPYLHLTLICFVKQHSNLGESSATMALICDSRSRRVLPVIWYRWSVSHFLKKTHFIISCPCSYLFNILSQSLLPSCSNNYKAAGSSSRTEREWGGYEVCSPVSVIENKPLLTMCMMYWNQARGHTLL